MGFSGPTAQLLGMLGAGIGGPMLSAMFAPEGQELQSFQDVPGLKPTDFLGQTRDLMGELGGLLSDRASQPVSLPSAYVQQPGAYTGGGLPMPIGVVGQDPALENPDLLTRPGMDTTRLGQMFRRGMIMPPAGSPPSDTTPGIDTPIQDSPEPPSTDGGDQPGDERPRNPTEFLGPRSPFDLSRVTDSIIGQPSQDVTTRPRISGDDLLDARAPEPADDFGLDALFASAEDNSGDDFDQGMANVQLLAAALSRGDVDLNTLLAGL